MLGHLKRKEKQRKINKSILKKNVLFYHGNLLGAAQLANEIIYCRSRNLCRVNKY